MAPASTDEYGVGIVCALPKEMLAAQAMLDPGYEVLRTHEAGDSNNYVVGQVHGHKVVIACLPKGVHGTVAAATVAAHMLRTFRGVRIGLMVGIGGGIPEPNDDGIIRLGDVVVSQPCDTHGGVVQHDQGKDVGRGEFILKGFLNRPPTVLLTALSTLEAAPGTTRRRLRENTSIMIQRAAEEDDGYAFPGLDRDVLFCARCDRSEWTLWHWLVWTLLFWLYPLWLCQLCHEQRIPRSQQHNDTEAHYGIIASGNVLLKNRHERDRLRVDFGAKCIEMEAAGLMNDFPCLVIRGICDYADSHKGGDWQKYAAITAAAFAKLLLSTVSPAQIYEVQRATTIMETARFFVPMERKVKSFFGRKDELCQIATYFDQARGESDKPRMLVLRAMGGQGKSQIALEYCHSVRDIYKGIFWINSSSTLAMTQSLVGVAEQLDHDASASLPDDEARIKFAIRTLGEWKHCWLLVFDNCDDASTFPELLGKFLPKVGQGSILFTSRHRDLEELGEVIEVPPMPQRAGIELLLHRYRGVSIDQYLPEASIIVDRLGNLALAIDQASAYMHYTQLPVSKLSTFLPAYLAQRDKILRHTAHNFWKYTKIDDSTQREAAVSAFTTWELSFQQFVIHNEPDGDRVAHFLTLSAFFGQLSVSELMFISHMALGKPPPSWMTIFSASTSAAVEHTQPNGTRACWESDRFWGIIHQAFQMSLLESISPAADVNGASLTLHPLIRDWLQLRVATTERQKYTRETIKILTSSIRVHTRAGSNADIKAATLLHMDAVLACDAEFFPEESGLGHDISTCDNIYWFASFYLDMCQYAASLRLFKLEESTRRRVQGAEHPQTLTSMNNLAIVLSEQGKYSDAEQIHRQVVEARERVLGSEHPDTLNSMNNLAVVLSKQGKYSDAEQIHRQVVGVSERVLGPEHPKTLTSMNNLATVLSEQGKYSDAEQIHRQVVGVSERVLGPEHPDTLNGINNLATVLSKQGKYSDAEHLYRQVVGVKERVLGPEHPKTLTSMNNLATVLSKQGKYSDAEQIHRQVVDIRERVLGPEHPNRLNSINNLAVVLSKQGKYSEAEHIQLQTVRFLLVTLGLQHPNVEASLNVLAVILEGQGRDTSEIERALQDTMKGSSLPEQHGTDTKP